MHSSQPSQVASSHCFNDQRKVGSQLPFPSACAITRKVEATPAITNYCGKDTFNYHFITVSIGTRAQKQPKKQII